MGKRQLSHESVNREKPCYRLLLALPVSSRLSLSSLLIIIITDRLYSDGGFFVAEQKEGGMSLSKQYRSGTLIRIPGICPKPDVGQRPHHQFSSGSKLCAGW